MSLLDYSQIPGYAEAVAQEKTNRDLAYLRESPPICGVPVRHLTARHWILLIGCQNRFFTGGRPRAEDVAIFLWFVSPRYSLVLAEREAFIAEVQIQLRQTPFVEIVRAVNDYLARAFQDCPSGGGGGKQYASPIASIVDLFASQYGWTDEQILEMPIARIFQQMRRMEMRLNPKAPQFNRSEQLVSAWLAETNRRN